MKKKERPVAGLDPVRSFPYYKIQVWNDRVHAWTDIQKKFESLGDLHAFAIAKLDWTAITRIMTVEGEKRRRVDELFDAFGEPR